MKNDKSLLEIWEIIKRSFQPEVFHKIINQRYRLMEDAQSASGGEDPVEISLFFNSITQIMTNVHEQKTADFADAVSKAKSSGWVTQAPNNISLLRGALVVRAYVSDEIVFDEYYLTNFQSLMPNALRGCDFLWRYVCEFVLSGTTINRNLFTESMDILGEHARSTRNVMECTLAFGPLTALLNRFNADEDILLTCHIVNYIGQSCSRLLTQGGGVLLVEARASETVMTPNLCRVLLDTLIIFVGHGNDWVIDVICTTGKLFPRQFIENEACERILHTLSFLDHETDAIIARGLIRTLQTLVASHAPATQCLLSVGVEGVLLGWLEYWRTEAICAAAPFRGRCALTVLIILGQSSPSAEAVSTQFMEWLMGYHFGAYDTDMEDDEESEGGGEEEDDEWVPEGGLAPWVPPPTPPLVHPATGWEDWEDGDGFPAFLEMASALM